MKKLSKLMDYDPDRFMIDDVLDIVKNAAESGPKKKKKKGKKKKKS